MLKHFYVGKSTSKSQFVSQSIERAHAKKPIDNLKTEGEFIKLKPKTLGPAQVRTMIKHEDNLKLEGHFENMQKKSDYVHQSKIERSSAIRQVDNLKMEGQFNEVRKRDEFSTQRGERANIVVREDNLRSDGTFHAYRKHNEYVASSKIVKSNIQGQLIDVVDKRETVHREVHNMKTNGHSNGKLY